MRVKTTASLSSTETVPSASAIALWNGVLDGSSTPASSAWKFHWLFAYACVRAGGFEECQGVGARVAARTQTQYGVSSVVPPGTAMPPRSFP